MAALLFESGVALDVLLYFRNSRVDVKSDMWISNNGKNLWLEC